MEDLQETTRDWPGVRARRGKMVLELTVGQRVGASGVLFLGDDVTDEDAFAALGPADAGVKVGDGVPTLARHRLPDTRAAAAMLMQVLQRRAGHTDSAVARRRTEPRNGTTATDPKSDRRRR